MILAALAMTALVSPGLAGGQPEQDTVQRVVALADVGDTPAALAAARAEPDPLTRARALVFLYVRCNDLPAALGAARAGLEHGADPWLLERATACAVSLGDAEAARGHLDHLELALDALPAPEAATWSATTQGLAADVGALESAAQAAQDALHRARAVTGVGLGLGALALALLTLRRGA